MKQFIALGAIFLFEMSKAFATRNREPDQADPLKGLRSSLRSYWRVLKYDSYYMRLARQ